MRTSPARRFTVAGVAKPATPRTPTAPIGPNAVAIAATLAAPAAIATPPEQCDPWDVAAPALPVVVNIPVIRFVGTPSKVAGQPSTGHFGGVSGSGVTIDPSVATFTNKQVLDGTAVVRVTLKDG